MAIPVFEDERQYEVINGQIYYMATPTSTHLDIQGNLFRIFSVFLLGKKCKVYSENSVHLKDETDTSDKANEPDYVVPDISIVCDRSKIKDDGIHGAPDLIVEILSKSTAIHDIIRKKDLYEQLGVREYWIVSPFDKSVTVYLLKNGKYVQDKVYYDVADRPDITMDTEKYPPYITTSLYGDDLKIYLKDVFFDLID